MLICYIVSQMHANEQGDFFADFAYFCLPQDTMSAR